MGLFSKQKTAFSGTGDWGFARYYYGVDIAKALRSIPGSEPSSLMTEKEKAAIEYLVAMNNLEMYEMRSFINNSNEEKQDRKEKIKDALGSLGDHYIVSLPQTNEFNRYSSQLARQKWERRLETFRKNGTVE